MTEQQTLREITWPIQLVNEVDVIQEIVERPVLTSGSGRDKAFASFNQETTGSRAGLLCIVLGEMALMKGKRELPQVDLIKHTSEEAEVLKSKQQLRDIIEDVLHVTRSGRMIDFGTDERAGVVRDHLWANAEHKQGVDALRRAKDGRPEAMGAVLVRDVNEVRRENAIRTLAWVAEQNYAVVPVDSTQIDAEFQRLVAGQHQDTALV